MNMISYALFIVFLSFYKFLLRKIRKRMEFEDLSFIKKCYLPENENGITRSVIPFHS